MSQPKYIDVNEFMNMLKANSLIIVSASEFESSKQIQRRKLMKRKSLSLDEILKAGFFPIKVTKTLIDWTISGKIKDTEWYKEADGKKRIMILTAAIKRLGYDE